MRDKSAFESHELWTLVEELKKSTQHHEQLPEETLQYLLALLNDLEARQKQTDHHYISTEQLSALKNYLSNIKRNPGNANTVNTNIDNAFKQLCSWPANNGRRIADIYKNTYEDYLKHAEKRIAECEKAANRVTELKEEFSNAQEAMQTKLGDMEEETSQQLEAMRDRQENELQQLNENAINSINTADDEYKNRLGEMANEAERLLDEVKTEASSISGQIIAKSYGDYARNKTRATVFYDASAILFAIVGIALVAQLLSATSVDEASITVFKLAISVATFTISGYLFRRGTFNQREARAAKRTELTLRQYEPFIACLDEETRNDITRQIAERIFIKGELDEKDATVADALGTKGLTDEQLSTLTEFAKTIATLAK